MGMELQELVAAYCEEPTSSLRSAIVSEAMPLVRSIIGKLRKPETPLSQFEDLESAGIMGLIQAIDNYDCEREIMFKTFAYYRIRGNIIDYLRSIDQLPRNDRTLFGRAQESIRKLQQEFGREPEDEEVAENLGINLKEYLTLQSNVQQRLVLSIDGQPNEDASGMQIAEVVDPSSENPEATMDREHMVYEIKKLVGKFKERDRLILALYYFEELNLREIALLVGLTEARVSQIIGKLLLQLRVNFKQN